MVESWYQLIEENYLMGFRDGRAFGRFDGGGFGDLSGPVQPLKDGEILEKGERALFFQREGRLFYANFPERKVAEIQLPEPLPVYGASHAWARKESKVYSVTGISFSKSIGIYDERGTLVKSLPYTREVDRWGQIRLGVNSSGDRFYLWYEPSAWLDWESRRRMSSCLDVVDGSGKVLAGYELPPLSSPPKARTWEDSIYSWMKAPFFYLGTLLYQKVGGELGSQRLLGEWKRRVGKEGVATREAIQKLSALSVLSAGLCWVLSRRAGLKRQASVFWAGLALMLNAGGLLLYLLLAERPLRLRCMSCGALRPLDREGCVSCGEVWLPPEKTGSEIFENEARLEEAKGF